MTNASIIEQGKDGGLTGEGFDGYKSGANITPDLNVGSYKLIYAFTIPNSPDHEGSIKVGEASVPNNKSFEEYTYEELEAAARARINSYTKTANISYNLEHVELAVRFKNDTPEGFNDHQIHKVLEQSGISRTKNSRGREWFDTNVEVVKKAIHTYKQNKQFIDNTDVNTSVKIQLRPEQEACKTKVLSVLKNGTVENPKKMLINAKMRFGKTFTAYSIIQEMAKNTDSFKVLITTHNPNDVFQSFLDDFKRSGMAAEGWFFGSNKNKDDFSDFLASPKGIWFTSTQKIRRVKNADLVEVEDFTENSELFSLSWNLCITDEAHAGQLTDLAKIIFKRLKTEYILDLSGTPFNIGQAENWEDEELAVRFSYDGRYNWSYVDERKAKINWEIERPDDPNPYEGLPEIKFITYDVSDAIRAGLEATPDGKITIKFSEFFAVEKDKFVHEKEVIRFLNKLWGQEEFSSDPEYFPFHPKWRKNFNHTLWMLPNVPACNAMEKLLKDYFPSFTIVNATGEGVTQNDYENALMGVKDAVKTKASITLSQQMLTTGVSIPEWTAVFMMNDTTQPMKYMQAAFRCTTMGSLPDGSIKDVAYVFDFNPDRCLREIVEVAQHNAKKADDKNPILDENNVAKSQDTLDRESVQEYLTYMNVLSFAGAKFTVPDSDAIMQQLNDVYVREIVEKGFDSPKLWDGEKLAHFDMSKARIVDQLRILSGGKVEDRAKTGVDISKLSEEDKKRLIELRAKEAAEKKRARDAENEGLTPEEKAEKTELENKKKIDAKNRKNAESILVNVAARMPMLVFASSPETKITPENFNHIVDEESWAEFMPKNLKRLNPVEAGEATSLVSLEERIEEFEALNESKNGKTAILYWSDIKQFFNESIFVLACERIRQLTREADAKEPLERALAIASLFSFFKSPDSETVLTPFRVVNLQYSNTLGGLETVDLENSTAKDTLVYTRNVMTGELESHHLQNAIRLVEEKTHEYAPVWRTSDVDPVEHSEDGFWEESSTTVFDINSKTALYPLYAALSLWYAAKYHAAKTKPGRRIAGAENVEDSEKARELRLWNEIVENQIFVNCRVPYSARIAERVLRGYNDEVKVNVSVIDVIQVRNKLKELGFYTSKTPPKQLKNEMNPEYRDRIERWEKTDPASNAEKVWQWLFNVNSLKRFSEEQMIGKDDKIRCMAEERVAQIMQAETGEDLLSALDTLDNYEQSITAVVSNPPYHIDIGKSHQIYAEFYETSIYLSKYVSMVFPLGWQTSKGTASGSKLHPIIRKDKSLVLVDNYYEEKSSPVTLFEGAGTGGVNIILRNAFVENNLTKFSEYGVFKEEKDFSIVSYYSDKDLAIFNALLEWNSFTPVSKTIISWFGIHAYCTTDPTRPDYGQISKTPFTKSIKVWANNKEGSGFDWWYFPEQHLTKNIDVKNKWKLFWQRSGAHANWRQTKIASPDELFTNTFIGRAFNSEKEVLNYETYFKTYLYRYLISSTAINQDARGVVHRFVPDLTDVINPRTGLKGYESDWADEDLKIVFKDVLTEEDWNYIIETAIAADPAGLKK